MQTFLYVGLIIFLGTWVYSLAGFGNALIAMPILISLLGPRGAAPLMSLISLTTFLIILLRFRRALAPQLVWRLILAALFTVPLGVYLLTVAPEKVVQTMLGLVILGYVLYRVFKLPLPPLRHPAWGFLFGGVAGVFGGMFNTAGPAVVIYADAKAWAPDQFRINLNSFFLFISIFSISSHFVAGNYNRGVLLNWLVSVPFMLLGLILGRSMEQYVDQARFRQLVLLLLFFLGARLSLSWL